MKKIDLHIHTVPTFSDSEFVFCLETFNRYVEYAKLDAVAITNHDVFDLNQFREIEQSLGAEVFPGIEINVDKGHVLVIGSASELDDFDAKAKIVSQKITKIGDSITVKELIEIYGNLDRYLVIPHYDKAPPVRGLTLEGLSPFFCAGEVDSAKKFIRSIKDESKPTPVLFSDFRVREGVEKFSTRQTFVDCGELSLNAIKTCLRDKSKVALSASSGNNLWQVFDNGQHISTGLNVLMGARSSGKTHTLDDIYDSIENVKYIRQFSLVQQSEAEYEREFNSEVERRRSAFVDDYLAGLKRIIDEVMAVDLSSGEREIDRYIETLLKSAEETDKQDAFSKAALFNEVDFPIGSTRTLRDLISSVRQVIENVEFREIIEKHVELGALKALACELIEQLWSKTLDNNKRSLVNGVVREIKQGLRIRTSAEQVEDFDLYGYCLDRKRVQRFTEVVNRLKREEIIFEETLQGFKIEAKKGPFNGAGEIKSASGVKTAFSDSFREYASPYAYLRKLMENERLSRADLYRLFVKITYRILNEDGFEVSGGERSEFRLLQEIADAQNHEMLLIDEPESSFDNLFLKSDVNQIIKAISETMPVVVVTHNNTVGASVGADYLLFAKKEAVGTEIVYRIYSGYPTDINLRSIDGSSIKSHSIMMDSLEAGASAYDRRRQSYEAIKD